MPIKRADKNDAHLLRIECFINKILLENKEQWIYRGFVTPKKTLEKQVFGDLCYKLRSIDQWFKFDLEVRVEVKILNGLPAIDIEKKTCENRTCKAL